jgi:hypothetical protein
MGPTGRVIRPDSGTTGDCIAILSEKFLFIGVSA